MFYLSTRILKIKGEENKFKEYFKISNEIIYISEINISLK